MFIIIVAVILAIIIFVLTGIDMAQETFHLNKKQLLAILPLLLILTNLIAIVPANTVGILYSPISGVKEETIPEGWNQKGLLDKVYKISTEVQSSTLANVTGQTKDAQWVNMIIDVKYQVNPSTAFQVFKQYKTLENVTLSLIPPTVQRSIESVTTKYNVMDLLGEKRNEVYAGIEADLKERLASSGITFVSINFGDTDAGAAIEAAIEAEATAKQAVKTAEQNRQKIEIEAQQKVVQAQADKQAAIIQAETRVIQAEAEAEVNRKMAESTTPLVIQRMEMQARLQHGWVTTLIEGSATPIIDTTK